MINYILLFPLIIGFLTTLFIMPYWIRKTNQINLLWDDMNKYSSKKVAGSGGIVAILGFLVATLSFVAYRTFYIKDNTYLIETFSLLLVITILAGVGVVDDVLGWHRGGLSRRSRIIMMLIASIPMMAINAGKHLISIPLIGQIDLGTIYPLVLIPLAVVGATTTYNFLAGFNGLEAGQGIIILTALSIVAYLGGNSWLSVISLCMVASLLAFMLYNFYPASVFPGNSLTYSIGGLIAVVSILGDFEKVAFFFFIPYIIETALKSRGALRKHSFGFPQSDNTLRLRYDKIYGLEHLAIWVLNSSGIGATEKKVVYTIYLFQIIVIIVGFVIFREGIFIK